MELINEEDTLKAIYLHEYGHIIKNHFQSKKISIQQANNKNNFYNLFSIGLAVLSTSANVGIGTSLTLNTRLINEISQHSVKFEIEADNFMISQIKKNKINKMELISFLENIFDQRNNYFKTHPRNEDRINNLKNFNYKKIKNSIKFDWIKSKYSKNSNNEAFNIYFKNLEKGIFNQNEKLNKIDIELVLYEAFKKGIFIIEWQDKFSALLNINKNSFLKIEYINYLLENNLENEYHTIDKLKIDKN